jgi:hypothetical protein
MVGLAAFLLAGGVVGCVEPTEPQQLNAPPQGAGLDGPQWGDAYTYHNDQGMMADRSIADLHFVPGTADLSGTGVARLERYAELLATTGGTLRYGPTIDDEIMIAERLATAQTFLAQAIPGAKEIEVVTGLPAGRGMGAQEAMPGRAVAQQPEPRGTAYHLSGSGGSGD